MDLVRSPRHVTAITGIRDLSPASEPDVWNVMADEVHRGAETIRFGGAFGVDTEALLAADAFRRGRTRLEVVVPARLQDQPDEAIDAAEVAADAVLELGLEPGTARSYLRRNDELIKGANRLIAFTDGREKGGTSYTIDRALERGLDVVIVPVRSKRGGRIQSNARIDFPGLSPVYALQRYVRRDEGSELTDFIWDLKNYAASPRAISRWAEQLALAISAASELREAEALVPMPRRDPALRSDLALLARAVGRITGQDVLEGWLGRVREPKGGEVLGGREHFSVDEHAETLAVEGLEAPRGLILLDNVITLGGTMAGAQRAVLRDTGLEAPGLALAYSADMADFVA